jgi:polyisoprenoid-binding protein YceI
MNQSRHARATRRNAILAAVVLATAGTLAAVTQAIAAPETYTIDPAHSAVGFSIRHLFSRVPGRFTKFDGKIVLDRDDFTKSSVDVSIDAASIDTNEPARDKHLKSPDFFDVAKNPKLTFKSTKVTQAGPTKLSVEGGLTIRGTTKPVTLDVDVLGFGPGYGGRILGGFEARTKINRQGGRGPGGRGRDQDQRRGGPGKARAAGREPGQEGELGPIPGRAPRRQAGPSLRSRPSLRPARDTGPSGPAPRPRAPQAVRGSRRTGRRSPSPARACPASPTS